MQKTSSQKIALFITLIVVVAIVGVIVARNFVTNSTPGLHQASDSANALATSGGKNE